MFSALASRKRTGTPAETTSARPSPLPTQSPIQKLRGRVSSSRLNEPSNPDYLAQKHKLDHLSAFLTAALQVLTESLDAWAAVAKQQSNFAALVDQAGLPNGTVKTKCAQAARSTAKCAADIKPFAMNTTVVPNAIEQLQRFREHVEGLQERYTDIRKMKRELEMSAQRLRSSQGKIALGSETVAKAEAQFNRGRQKYEAMVRRMADRMEDANRRMPEVVRTVHYVFWLLQDKACERLVGGTEPAMKSGNAAEPALCYVTFCQGLRPPASIFQSLEKRSSSRRRKRRTSLFSTPTDAQE